MANNGGTSNALALIKHAARGGVKSIPLLGALAEEMIFGTLDEVDAKEQAAKLNAALAEIQSSTDAQSMATTEVLQRVIDQQSLNTNIIAMLGELQIAIRDGEAATISERLQQSVNALFLHHQQRLDDTVANVERLVEVLEDHLSSTLVSPTGSVTLTPPALDRLSLIKGITSMDPVNLNKLILALSASGIVSESVSAQQRALELIRYVEGTAGPGIPELCRIAVEFGINFPPARR